MEKFAMGVLLGGLAGALLTANNYKMRMLVKKGQEEVQTKLNTIIDDKIDALDEGIDALKEQSEEKAEEQPKKKRR